MLIDMAPKPEFTSDDYVDPNVPEDELRIRSDHPQVRDLSYDRSRMRQLNDLYKGAMFDPGWDRNDALDPDDESTWQTERLELYIKERARGKGYVSDFIYNSRDLPVTVYGILINRGRGLEIAELELFRTSWGYFDDWGDFVGEDGNDQQKERSEPEQLITSDVLRRIPLGRIVAMAQQSLAHEAWRTDGLQVLMGRDRGPDELTSEEVNALESGARAAKQTKRGRPPLPDSTLTEIAHAYLEEAPAGVGLLKRLAARFDRPEATVRDWIASARREGFLTPAIPGKRGAGPGPRLTTDQTRRSPGVDNAG
ncbi:hypothetical protein GCM10009861_18700 [Neomicrococcus aestuarii]